MTFEDDFPSLKNSRLFNPENNFTGVAKEYNNFIIGYYLNSIKEEIQKYCLDKQKVVEAIHKYVGGSFQLDKLRFLILEELGLIEND